MAMMDTKDIEERLVDHTGDAIGGEGSVSIVSGASIDTRGAIVSHVLEEAEGMGCLVARFDFRRPVSGQGSLAAVLASLVPPGMEGREATSMALSDEGREAERSYRTEMACLDQVRSAAAGCALVLALEELGEADRRSLDLFRFLARNIGGNNVLIIATHRSAEDDIDLSQILAAIGPEVIVHSLHLHGTGPGAVDPGPPARHEDNLSGEERSSMFSPSSSIAPIAGHLRSSGEALRSGRLCDSVSHAMAALEGSRSIVHHGLELDSHAALGLALTQIGQEREALAALDRAICLAKTLGEPASLHMARVRRSELELFSIGEPDSASTEALSAISTDLDEKYQIEPLALKALVEAGNGRRDRAEASFCEASGLIEKLPLESLMLERMLLALTAAIILEGRFDLVGMNQRYQEAQVLASGTDHPLYWGPTVSLQRGRSLLRLKRPREAKHYLEEAARQFSELGNEIQSMRSKRAMEISDAGITMD